MDTGLKLIKGLICTLLVAVLSAQMPAFAKSDSTSVDRNSKQRYIVILNDPPLAAVSADPDFQPLESLLADSDIVTLHIPLVKEKPWPTERLADYCFFCFQ